MSMAFDAVSDTDDETLLALYANGDSSAAHELIGRLAPKVLSLAQRMLQDTQEAEDVVQEAMLKLWKIAPDWENGRAKPSTWLHRVAHNICIDRLRKTKGKTVALDFDIEDETAGPLAGLIHSDRANALHIALSELPARQSAAIHLRHFEELPNDEIADIMDVSIEAVESLLARARRSLKTKLAHQKNKIGWQDEQAD